MKAGRLSRCGPPLEVYRNPANIFVAGFLASPPMNLLDARVVAADGGLAILHGELRLPVPADYEAAYALWQDKPVILGLRPEDIYEQPVEGCTAVDMTVVAVEALGPATILVPSIRGGAGVAAPRRRPP